MTSEQLAAAHLAARVRLIEIRVRALVEHRRQDDPAPDDPFRGLYLTDQDVDRVLAGRVGEPDPDPAHLLAVERAVDEAEARGDPPTPLRALQRSAGLADLDVDILLAVLAPDLDARFEQLYGYLNDDVTRRRASIGLALQIAGAPAASAAARSRFSAGSPLPAHRLVVVDDLDRPFLTRALRAPDRVTSHLLGGQEYDPELTDVLSDPDVRPEAIDGGHGALAAVTGPEADLARLLAGDVRLVYLRDLGRRTGRHSARAALRAAGWNMLELDLDALAAQQAPDELARLAGREALLRRAGVLAGPVEALTTTVGVLRRLADLPVPVLLIGDVGWDPAWSRTVPLQVDAPELAPVDRESVWRAEIRAPEPAPPVHLHLGPDQIGRAVRWARLASALGDRPLDEGLLQAGARAQNAAGLERLARRVEPGVAWDDLVLPEAVTSQLRELAARARYREQVLTGWRMRPGGGRGHGVTALFAGDSGTGKTMSAEVIAGELGLDLYKVDLATVVDKYVGETEKNLERIFTEAAGVNAVLLFDEADAVFGKRSEVRDAHDRYANIESAYLLQRMETFDGLAVLSTNLRANIDEAFTRRLDGIVDFPAPDAELRLALWQRCLVPPLPVAGDLDLAFCADAFELTGGNIRSAAITAAYLAAAAGEPVAMRHLISAVQQEYRKLGRLVLEREFGGYLSLLR